MNQEQYSRLRENRRRRGPLSLGQPGRPGGPGRTALSVIVGQAARVLRRREAAEAAWERVAGAELLAETAVDRLDGDTLYVSAASSTLSYELQRRRSALEKRVAAVVPGIRRLRFVVGGRPASGPRPVE